MDGLAILDVGIAPGIVGAAHYALRVRIRSSVGAYEERIVRIVMRRFDEESRLCHDWKNWM